MKKKLILVLITTFLILTIQIHRPAPHETVSYVYFIGDTNNNGEIDINDTSKFVSSKWVIDFKLLDFMVIIGNDREYTWDGIVEGCETDFTIDVVPYDNVWVVYSANTRAGVCE